MVIGIKLLRRNGVNELCEATAAAKSESYRMCVLGLRCVGKKMVRDGMVTEFDQRFHTRAVAKMADVVHTGVVAI